MHEREGRVLEEVGLRGFGRRFGRRKDGGEFVDGTKGSTRGPSGAWSGVVRKGRVRGRVELHGGGAEEGAGEEAARGGRRVEAMILAWDGALVKHLNELCQSLTAGGHMRTSLSLTS